MKDLRVIFMGTPDFAVPILQGLIDNTNVVLVVSQPDRPVGRKKELKKTPIKALAESYNIEVFQPEKIKEEESFQKLKEYNPDIIVTCAYGQIIPNSILDLPKHRCINVHASLLPYLRGGAPIHHSIIDGYDKTGITIMYMENKMDAGDIISQEETKILDSDNLETLHDRLSMIGSKLLIETLPNIISGNINPLKQDESSVTYAWNIKREEEKLDFNKTTREVFNHIRGLSPTPGSYTTLDEENIKVYASRISDKTPTGIPGEITNLYEDGIGVKTNDGEIIITEIQFPGKKRMTVKDYFNGQDKNKLKGKRFN